jgi:hypothetical protein
MKKLPTLYKKDTKGKIREWTICVHQNKFWTEGGIHGMKMNIAKPTICVAKNIGCSNETSPEQQAEAEAQAKWDKKLRSGYFTNINDIDDKKFYEPMLAYNYKDRVDEVKFPVYSQQKLDGCLSGDTLIELEDGRIITIGEVVQQKINCKVKIYNVNSNQVEYKTITAYMENENNKGFQWFELELEDGKKIKLTGNHPVWLPDLRCYRRVDQLKGHENVLLD